MTVETRPASSTAPAGESDDDADDAPVGEASGSANTAPAGDGEPTEDYREKFLAERRKTKALSRQLAETKAATTGAPDVEAQLKAANDKAASLEADLHRERTYTRLTQEAARQGAVDPEVVANLLIASDDLDTGDDGKPTNATDAVKELLKNKPYLAGKPAAPRASGDAGAGRRGDTTQTDFNSAFRKLAAK